MSTQPTNSFEEQARPQLRAIEGEMGADALFREARRRRRLRWLIGVCAVLAATAAAIGTTYGLGGGVPAKQPPVSGASLGSLHVFREASASMEPTLRIGDVVEVTTDFGKLRRGDVVLINLPGRYHIGPVSKAFKRIIGLPGEAISSSGSTILVNGSPLSEPYLPPGQEPGSAVSTQSLPKDEYFVLGDNRADSLDSRYFGPIPLTSIVGVADRIVAPSPRSGPVPGS